LATAKDSSLPFYKAQVKKAYFSLVFLTHFSANSKPKLSLAFTRMPCVPVLRSLAKGGISLPLGRGIHPSNKANIIVYTSDKNNVCVKPPIIL